LSACISASSDRLNVPEFSRAFDTMYLTFFLRSPLLTSTNLLWVQLDIPVGHPTWSLKTQTSWMPLPPHSCLGYIACQHKESSKLYVTNSDRRHGVLFLFRLLGAPLYGKSLKPNQ
jgi:hypothetical protein